MEENKTNVTETKQEDKGLSQIQPNEKRSWWSIAFIWVGTMICIPMLMVGGIFGSVLTMSSIFWATLIGFAICCTMMILGGIVGSDTGLNATMCSTRAFGMTGANFTMALVIFICEAGLSLGKKFGTKLSGKASILGGVILIGIGLEIFISGVFG